MTTQYVCLPWELWLRRMDALVRRCLLAAVPSLSELLVCSRSAEESESSVPSEPLPATGLCHQNTHTEELALNNYSPVLLHSNQGGTIPSFE